MTRRTYRRREIAALAALVAAVFVVGLAILVLIAKKSDTSNVLDPLPLFAVLAGIALIAALSALVRIAYEAGRRTAHADAPPHPNGAARTSERIPRAEAPPPEPEPEPEPEREEREPEGLPVGAAQSSPSGAGVDLEAVVVGEVARRVAEIRADLERAIAAESQPETLKPVDGNGGRAAEPPPRKTAGHALTDAGDGEAPAEEKADPVEPVAWDSCEIAWWRGPRKAGFEARGLRASGQSSVVARSRMVSWTGGDTPAAEGSIAAAHEALVKKLEAEGWEPAGSAGEWYAAKFRRPAGVTRREPRRRPRAAPTSRGPR